MKSIFFILGFFSAAIFLPAQSVEYNPESVSVRIGATATVYTSGASLHMHGSVEPSTAIPDGAFVADVAQNSGTISIVPQTLRMEPDKLYLFFFSGTHVKDASFTAKAPPGYKIDINDYERERFKVVDPGDLPSRNLWVRVRRVGSDAARRAGTASSILLGKIRWEVALGSVDDGSSAGSVIFSMDGRADDWSGQIALSNLNYEAPPNAAVEKYAPNGVLREVYANQATMLSEIDPSNGFSIKFYHPYDVAPGIGSGLSTPSGNPYVVYKLERSDTDTSLKITSQTYDTSGSLVRTAYTELKRAGSAPSYTWTLTDWTTVGQSSLKQSVWTWSENAGKLVKTLERRVPSSSNDYYNSRTYGAYGWGDEVDNETIGTGSESITKAYSYYSDSSSRGSYSFVKSMVATDGSWVGYEYMPAATDDAEVGLVKRVHKPFGNSPATVPGDLASNNLGEITEYTYSVDPFGSTSRLASETKYVNGVIAAKTTIDYNDDFTSNGMSMVRAIQRDFPNGASSDSNVTQIFYYREDVSDQLFRGKTHSISNPDGSKVAYAYQRGTYNSQGVFTPVSNGVCTRITTIITPLIQQVTSRRVGNSWMPEERSDLRTSLG